MRHQGHDRGLHRDRLRRRGRHRSRQLRSRRRRQHQCQRHTGRKRALKADEREPAGMGRARRRCRPHRRWRSVSSIDKARPVEPRPMSDTALRQMGSRRGARRAHPDVVNVLSMDVEEYSHATIFREGTRGLARGSFVSRVEESMDRVLALLADADVRATCFVLGEVAAAHPAMVRKIAGEGHEVACHGHHHELVWHQSPEEFRADSRRAKELLEDVTGQSVIGYRAASFSIGPEQTWAYDILLQEGFRYDSSIYPIYHDRYG